MRNWVYADTTLYNGVIPWNYYQSPNPRNFTFRNSLFAVSTPLVESFSRTGTGTGGFAVLLVLASGVFRVTGDCSGLRFSWPCTGRARGSGSCVFSAGEGGGIRVLRIRENEKR